MTTKSIGLAILICSPTIEHPELCVTPIVHAIAARALDCEVEVHFAGPAIRWLVEGVADSRYPTVRREKPIRDFLQEASTAGARILACSMARANWVGQEEKLIAECAGNAGATAFLVRMLSPDWRTMVF